MKSHEATFRTMQIIHQKLGNLREYCKKTGKLCYDEIRGWWLAKTDGEGQSLISRKFGGNGYWNWNDVRRTSTILAYNMLKNLVFSGNICILSNNFKTIGND